MNDQKLTALERARRVVLAAESHRPVALTFAEATALFDQAERFVQVEPMTADQFLQAVAMERASHLSRGYNKEHDREQGISHLLRWAIDYASRGEVIKSGSLVIAALDIASIEERERYESRAAIDSVLEIHKAVGFDIDDDGTLDPDNNCCDYCSERDGEAVIYPCETVRALGGAIKPSGVLK